MQSAWSTTWRLAPSTHFYILWLRLYYDSKHGLSVLWAVKSPKFGTPIDYTLDRGPGDGPSGLIFARYISDGIKTSHPATLGVW